MPNTLPTGITSAEPMPYGYRRWNGKTWPDVQVDAYNAELARIISRHNAGMSTDALVSGLYNLAHGFDFAPSNLANVRLSDLPDRLRMASLAEIREFQAVSQNTPEFRDLIAAELRDRGRSVRPPVIPDEGWLSN